MDALGFAAAHVTGGNGHFVSGYRALSEEVEARKSRGGTKSDGDDRPVRPKVSSPLQGVSLDPDTAAVEP